MALDPARCPSWPAMMDEDTGRDYFGGIGSELFHAILASQGIAAIELPARRTMWARVDLDRALDSLARRGVTLPPQEPVDAAALALQAAERRAASRGR